MSGNNSNERKKSNAAPPKKASLLASFDEVVRYGVALSRGDEEEVIDILNRQENARKLWVSPLAEATACRNL